MGMYKTETDHWPNFLDCTDLEINVEPAVTQNCVASVTYKTETEQLQDATKTNLNWTNLILTL